MNHTYTDTDTSAIEAAADANQQWDFGPETDALMIDPSAYAGKYADKILEYHVEDACNTADIDDGRDELGSTDWNRWANPLKYRRLPGSVRVINSGSS